MNKKDNNKALHYLGGLLFGLLLLVALLGFIWNYYARLHETASMSRVIASYFFKEEQLEAEEMECGINGNDVDDELASQSKARESKPENTEYFVCGPFRPLFPGNYTVTFTLRNSAAEAGIVTIDVASRQGATIIATQEISTTKIDSAYSEFTLTFETEFQNAVEMRVSAPSGIYVDTVTISAESKNPVTFFSNATSFLSEKGL